MPTPVTEARRQGLMTSLWHSTRWLVASGCRRCICVLALVSTLAVCGSLAADAGAQSEDFAYSVELEGEIDSLKELELERVLADAQRKNARLVILRLDTPGGEADSTRAMVRAMLAAPLPVVVYVAPDGARAASAGMFLTVAGDVAAMSPQTNIGSASPISIGPQGVEEMSGVLYRKILNDSAAYARALAEGHGRNGGLAERMVRRATNVTAREARREGLVDVVAGSEAALLQRLDGFEVQGGKARVLRTAGLRVVRFDPPAPADEPTDSSGDDGVVLLGVGLPGLIAIGMVLAVIALLARQVLNQRFP